MHLKDIPNGYPPDHNSAELAWLQKSKSYLFMGTVGCRSVFGSVLCIQEVKDGVLKM
jgi:hypothetical protein